MTKTVTMLCALSVINMCTAFNIYHRCYQVRSRWKWIWNDNEIGIFCCFFSLFSSLSISIFLSLSLNYLILLPHCSDTFRKYNKINSKRNYLSTYAEWTRFGHVEMETFFTWSILRKMLRPGHRPGTKLNFVPYIYDCAILRFSLVHKLITIANVIAKT